MIDVKDIQSSKKYSKFLLNKSNLDKSINLKDLHPENIEFISAFEVLKFDISIDINELHPKNI